MGSSYRDCAATRPASESRTAGGVVGRPVERYLLASVDRGTRSAQANRGRGIVRHGLCTATTTAATTSDNERDRAQTENPLIHQVTWIGDTKVLFEKVAVYRN